MLKSDFPEVETIRAMTDTVIEIGGYRTNSIGEDMELVVRMHRVLRERGAPYRIEFVPELPKTATGKIQRFKLRAASA